MRSISSMLYAVLILNTVGCTHLEVSKLKWLESEDISPQADLKAALENQDCRFRGVYGYSLDIPGTDESPLDQNNLIKVYGVNPIEGTSDFIRNKKHMHRIILAKEYARTYNRLLLQKISAGAQCKAPE